MKAAIQPGDIVTEIKMTVGQNNKNDGGGVRSRADSSGQKVFNGGPGGGGGNGRRLPPPKLVSTSPPPNVADGDGMLLGMYDYKSTDHSKIWIWIDDNLFR